MNEQKDKVQRIKATYYDRHLQAHPLPDQNEPIDNPWHDLVVVLVAIGVIILIAFLASLVPGHQYT